MKKKIGYLLEDARISGPFNQILNLTISLHKIFDQKVIFSNYNSKNARNILEKNNVKYISLNTRILNSNIFIFILYIFNFIFTFKNIYYEIKKCQFDLVLVNGSRQFKFLLICWLLKIKIIWCINDAYANNILKYFISIFSYFPNHIVFVSTNSKNFYLKNFFKRKYSVISSSHNFNNILNKEKKFLFDLSKSKLLDKKFVVGTMGNISPVKNYEFMIEIAKLANSKDKNIFFLVGGSFLSSQKKYNSIINNKIKKNKLDNLQFLDYVHDTFAFYNSIDIYACYSKSEASPTSVWEAMYLKKPIISTNVGDLKLLNSLDQFGFVLDEADPNIFLNKIIKIKNDKNLFEKLSKSSYFHSESFTSDKISTKYLNLFNDYL